MKKILIFVLFFLLASTCAYSATITVTDNGDSGAGTLRQAISDAADGDTIDFNLSGGNEAIVFLSTISLSSSKSITIDGANTAGSGTQVTLQVATPGTTTIRLFELNPYGTDKTITLQNLTLRGGDVSGLADTRGAILHGDWVRGVLNIENCIMREGKADWGGGALFFYQTASAGITFTVNITNCTFEANYTNDTGGAIYSRDMDITINITGSQFLGNYTTDTSGAYGGGAINGYETVMNIDKCLFYNNYSSNTWGGGAIQTYAGTTTITNSTFVSNEATQTYGAGGALQLTRSGAINIVANSTFFDNEAYSSSAIGVSGDSTLTNLTVANNYSRQNNNYGSGAVSTSYPTSTKIKNCILANNTYNGGNIDFSETGSGDLVDNGYNIVEYFSGYTAWSGPGNITGPQAGLNLASSLADNSTIYGTQTLALSAGSPAINAGNGLPNSSYAIPGRDQRGMIRSGFGPDDPSGRNVDIGAYEYNASVGNVISVTTTGAGSVYPQGPAGFSTGESQTFVITPEVGYVLSDVEIDSVSQGAISSYAFSSISSDHTVAVTFAEYTHTITAEAGNNGTVSPSGEVSVADTNNQTFTFEADSNYHIAEVLIDGTSTPEAVGLTSYTYTFESVSQNHTISATFEIDTFIITVESNSGGTIYPGDMVTAEYGSNQTILITPEAGYYVDSVTVNGSSEGSITSYTFNNITANQTMEVDFQNISYYLTSEAGSNGSISPLGTTTKTYNTSQTYILTPNTGYDIDELLVDGAPASYSIISGDKAYQFSNIQTNHTISVTFTDEAFVITSEAGSGGSISPLGMVNKTYGESQTYTITPDSGYGVGTLTVDESTTTATTEYSFSNITSHHTIATTFVLTTVDAPTNCVATAASTSQINLSWINNAAVVSENRIERSTDGTTYTKIATTDSDATSYSATGLTSNTRYWFRVRAENGGTYSDYATSEAKYTFAEAIPSGTSESISTTSITVSWEAGNNPTGTKYYCENQTKGTNSGWITDTSWTSLSLTAETTYTFRAKARNGDNTETSWFNIGSITTSAGTQPASISIGTTTIVEGDIISDTPKISVTAILSSSASSIMAKGIISKSIDANTFRLYIDGSLVTDGTNTYYDSVTQASDVATFEYTPKTPLSVGTHTIRVIFSDTSGTDYEAEYTGLKVLTATAAVSGVPLCYPNPYNPTQGKLRISYYLAVDTDVLVYIFNAQGEIQWKNSYANAGTGGQAGYNEITWDGRNMFGNYVMNNIYLIRIVNNSNKKMLGKARLAVIK